jgi:hypothetical protein
MLLLAVVVVARLFSPCAIMLAVRLTAARCVRHTCKAQKSIDTFFYIVVHPAPAFFLTLPPRSVPIIPLP